MIKQAIIPLAGLGTRLLPLTSVMPKELLPINGKPGLEYILDECLKAGIKEVIIPKENETDLVDMPKKIIDEINLDSVKIQYDIYHMQIMEGDIIRTFDNNKDKIGHIQIADNPGRNEPGSGEINYENVFKHLSENYLGWIGCGYSPLGDTIKGLSWIDNIGGKSA